MVDEKERNYLDELQKERDGYVMRNPKSGVEIKCTEAFVQHWQKRGFVVVTKGKINLVE